MKLLSKISSQSSVYALLSQASVFGFAFLVFLVLVRTLSTEDFGVWVLYQTVMTFAEMARMGFIQNGLVKYLSAHPDSTQKILGSAWLLNLMAGVSLWLIVWGLSFQLSIWWKAPGLTDLFLNYGLIVLSWGAFRFIEYVLVSRQDFRAVFWGHTSNGLIYISLVGYAAWIGWLESPVQVLWLQSIAAGLTVAGLYIKRRGWLKMARPSKEWLSKLANYGRFAMGTSLGSMILQRLDVLMLGYFLGPAPVAIYNIGTKLTNYLEIPLRAISLQVFPRLSAAYENEGGKGVKPIYEQAIGQLLALVLPPCILLFLFAEPAVVLIAGPEYAESAQVLQVFLLIALIKPWGRISGISMDAIGKPRLNFRLVWVSLFLNLGWNFFFIPRFGVMGAAWATVLSMALTTIIGQVVLRKLAPIQTWQPLLNIGKTYREFGRMAFASNRKEND